MSLGAVAAAGPPPNEDGMLLLEVSFARVPHEELRRHLRTQQRHVERDLGFCASTLEALAKAAKGGPSLLPASSSSSSVAAYPSPGDVSAGEASFLGDVSFSSEGVSMLAGEASFSDDPETQAQRRREDFDRSLDVMISRVSGLKKRLANVHDLAGPALTRLDARTQHLGELQSIQSITSPAFEDWCRTRLDRMLVDWLLRKGHLETGKMLAEKKGIESYTELSLFAEIARIEASLVGTGEDGSRSCAPTLAWCSENKAALRKIKSTLEFELRLQEFIELARSRVSMPDALAYVRRHLLPYLVMTTEDEEDRQQAEILRQAVSRAMGLLACGPTTKLYADTYSHSRWEKLRENFRKAALQIHSLPRQSTLQIALSAGLSSLKLPACYDERNTSAPPHLGGKAFGDDIHVTEASISAPEPIDVVTGSTLKNSNCPVCDTSGLGVLAKEVPWSHHANSTLVCAISGKIMNENDPPMALPNARVYSLSALQEMAMSSLDGETITCPRTGDTYPFRSLRKVFIS